MAHTDERIVKALESVWQTSKDHTIDIIKHLDNTVSTDDYFLRCLEFLKPMDINPEGNIVITHSNNDIVVNSLTIDTYGKGSYGSVSLSAKDLVYKKIKIARAKTYTMEQDVREIFLETFIQSVLSSDERFYKNIAQISRLYRSEETPESEIVLDVVMQNVPMTIEALFENYRERSNISHLGLDQLAPMLIKVGTVLADLQTAYRFFHNDLHKGNILFHEDGAPFIIDFGKACCTIKGTTYSMKMTVCRSWDLSILLMSLLEFEGAGFDEELITVLLRVLTSEDGLKLYEYALTIKKRMRLKSAFHAMYSDVIIGYWDPYERTEIRTNTPLLEPERFAAFLKGVLNNFAPPASPPKKLERQSPQRTLNISSVKNGSGYKKTRKRRG